MLSRTARLNISDLLNVIAYTNLFNIKEQNLDFEIVLTF